jgi:hypothetical protein
MNVESVEIQSYLRELPEINYSRTGIKLWQYLILPSCWLCLYKEHQARKEMVQEINSVKGNMERWNC